MSSHDVKPPTPKNPGRRPPLYAVPDLHLRNEELERRVAYLTARIAAGDQMVVDLKHRLDEVRIQVERLSRLGGEAFSAHPAGDDHVRHLREVPEDAAATSQRTGLILRAVVAVTAITTLSAYWAAAWLWRWVSGLPPPP